MMIGALDWLIDEPPRIRNTGSLPGWLLAVETRTPGTLPFRASPIELDRNAFQIGAAHLRDGAGQRAARLGAVTDDHHVVQHVVVLGEPHVDLRPVADRDLLRLITQIIEYQHRTRTGNDDFVIALNVGRDARLGAFDHDRRTDDRLAGAGRLSGP